MKANKGWTSLTLAVSVFAFGWMNAYAQGYGIYDARALALGGATVAIANTSHAQFYNPALISLHDGLEEKTRDGRVYFPMINSQISDVVSDLINIDDDNLEENLTNAVNTFNADPSAANADALFVDTQDLLDAIKQVDDKDASVEGFFGISISEPSDREGGAFHMGVRVIGGGTPDITDTDLALLEDYIEALEFASTAGQQGEAHPELFNADGSLSDPAEDLTSTAVGRGAAILEFGVSVSHEVSIGGADFSIGATPKLMLLRTYDSIQTINGDGATTLSDDQGFRAFNLDLGFATEITDELRVGLAVKDVVAQGFATELGSTLRIRPKPRLGIGYVTDRFQLGLDYDLTPSEPLATESAVQDLSIGGEWRALDIAYLRIGYRHDLEMARKDIFSAGLGLEFQTLLFDFTYATGEDGSAAALQMGYVF